MWRNKAFFCIFFDPPKKQDIAYGQYNLYKNAQISMNNCPFSENIYAVPQSCTEYYKKEIRNCMLDEIWVAYPYTEIQHMIKQYKYHANTIYATYFADILLHVHNHCCKNEQNFITTIVPMHGIKYFSRGFNHLSIIAKYMKRNYEIPYIPLLQASFLGKQQAKLTKKQRTDNTKNIYKIRKNKKVSETVILLDDVVSTGSTLNTCASILKAHGVKKVIAIALASNQL